MASRSDSLVRPLEPSPSRANAGARAIRSALNFAKRKPLAASCAVIVLLLLFAAAFGPLLAPYDYDAFTPRDRLQGPSTDYYFGTDDQGRDVFSRVLYGARIAVLVGFGATLVAIVLATLIGMSSAYFGGIVDLILQRIIEIWMTFPGIIFVIFVISIFGASTMGVVLILGILFSAGSSRVIRGAALSISTQAFVESATASGASHGRVLFRHILPNLVPVIIITASVQIGGVILAESSLAFLGFGVPPPFPSWGRMLQDAQRFMQSYPHLAIFPGTAIALVVFSFNIFGDGLRDVLDPRLRGS